MALWPSLSFQSTPTRATFVFVGGGTSETPQGAEPWALKKKTLFLGAGTKQDSPAENKSRQCSMLAPRASHEKKILTHTYRSRRVRWDIILDIAKAGRQTQTAPHRKAKTANKNTKKKKCFVLTEVFDTTVLTVVSWSRRERERDLTQPHKRNRVLYKSNY